MLWKVQLLEVLVKMLVLTWALVAFRAQRRVGVWGLSQGNLHVQGFFSGFSDLDINFWTVCNLLGGGHDPEGQKCLFELCSPAASVFWVFSCPSDSALVVAVHELFLPSH